MEWSRPWSDLPRTALIVCHKALSLAVYGRFRLKLSPVAFFMDLCHPRVWAQHM